jgi:CubicO group peptidase (beta-lactamase class C family)
MAVRKIRHNKPMRIFVLQIAVFVFALLTACQTTPKWAPYESDPNNVYPEMYWQKTDTPERLGWSSEKLAEARAYSEKIGSAAVMIVDDGVVVAAWGDVTRKFKCHSMRKSLLSALIGIHVAKGNIDLAQTMEDLGIDDYEPALTIAEKQATVGDFIKARSGIYHAALGENQMMRDMRPARHSHAPGTFWYYNNWDFNALGTIFEQETKTTIFAEFNRRFAKPLQMEDFKVSDCRYESSDDVGKPFLSKQSYYASGWGGQKIIVLPYRKLVIVHRGNTDGPGKRASPYQIGRLLWHILNAAGETDIGPDPSIEAATGVQLNEDDMHTLLAVNNKWIGPNTGIFPGGKSLVFICSQDGRLTFSVGRNIKFTGNWWIGGDRFYFKIFGMKAYFHIVKEGRTIKLFDPGGTLFGRFDVLGA